MRHVLYTLLLMLLLVMAMVSSATVEVTPVPSDTPLPIQPTNPQELIHVKGCLENLESLPYEDLWFLNQNDARLSESTLIFVDKTERKAMLFSEGKLIHNEKTGQPACWKIALGITPQRTHPIGPKTRRGDRKTPEGWYRTSDRPQSDYHGALLVHYPNPFDAKHGLDTGRINQSQYQAIVNAEKNGQTPLQNTRLGSDILLHGGGSSRDWTWGCIGFENQDIDALRMLLPENKQTNILIVP